MAGWTLAGAAAAFWCGIVLAGLGSIGLGAGTSWGLLAVGLTALTWTVRRRRRVLTIAGLAVSFLALGVGWESLHLVRLSESPLAQLRARTVRVTGSMASDPRARGVGWTATVSVDLVELMGSGGASVIRAHDALWVEGRGEMPRIGVGDRIEAVGLLASTRGSFGQFLRRRGLAGALQADRVIRRGPPSSWLVRAADALRSTLARSLRRVLPRHDAGLVMGLALGDTSMIDARTDEDFRATGLSHLTAVSGENVAMFLAPIMGLGMLAGLGRRGRLILGLGATAFFVVLTRAEPSVLRAALMAGLTMLGVFLGRPRSPPAIVGAAVLLLIGLDPTLVYAIGFQLSVAATVGMALLAGPFAERLRFLPRWLALAAGTTLGAQAGVTPLLLYHFGVVPTVTLPANLLAFPAVGPGMILGLAAAAVGLAVRPAGALIGLAAHLPLSYLQGLADRLARSPLPSLTSNPGGLLTLAGGLAAVVLLAWLVRARPRLRGPVLVSIAVVVPLFVWSSALGAGSPSTLTITFFDIGQGDAALVRSPAGAAILIDGGPDPEEVARKLAALGIRRLDLMVATHPHADHVAGLPAVLTRFPVGLAIDPGCPGDSPYYGDFLRAVRDHHVPFQHPGPGTVLRVGDVRLDVLGPERCFTGTNSDPNNDSMILRVSDGWATVLFPGDAEQPSQTDLLRDDSPELVTLVLKVPHHGGDTSLPTFFEAVHARVAVVSVGPNRYGHPVPGVLAELAADGMRVYRTDRSGDVTVTFADGQVLVSPAHG